jgi:uncharacterized protein YcnI
MMRMKKLVIGAGGIAAILLTMSTAYAHVTVQPKQSEAGATETYTIRVPTEKFVPTVRVEVEFPSTLTVASIEPKAGWKIEQKKDSVGRLVGAVFTGSIPPGESNQFNFTARNPKETGKITFKAIQIYEDGSTSEWTGAEGTRSPAPVVELK